TQIAPYDRQFASKSVGQRGMQLFAGPMMNFVLAILLFLVIGLIQGIPSEKALLGEVQDGSPAEEAGLQQGDVVTQVDESYVTNWEEVTAEIEQTSEELIAVMVKRGDEATYHSLVPREAEDVEGKTIGQAGIYQANEK